VAWKVDDQPAKVYEKFDFLSQEMHDQLVKSWKMQKARELARTAADEFVTKVHGLAQKELRDANSPFAFLNGLTDIAATSKYSVLTAPIRIAKLKKQPAFRPGQPARYEEPFVSNKQILYPPTFPGRSRSGDLMAEQLLELRNKPLGETMVVPNQPRDHFYIAVMTNKEDLTIENFYRDVFATSTGERDPLYFQAVREMGVPAFRKDYLERLRAETKYEESAELKKQDAKSPPEPFEP
jgi:hypothetical protein